MELVSPSWFAEAMAALTRRQDLSPDLMRRFLSDVIAGRCGEIEATAVLVALRVKGETAGELAAAAALLREHMIRLETPTPDTLDTCGTGGDGSGTFNVSTATAFVVAGAGVPVAKHGNRAVSSRSGSADVLAALGVAPDAEPAVAKRCLEQAGLAFCFAPRFHPALRHVAPLRRRLGMRTLFNWLGPLVNPASTPYQLLGVGNAELLDPLAQALAQLGTRHAFLVTSRDGLDEVSLAAPTRVREVRGDRVSAFEWTPEDFGLARCSLEELKADGVEASAAIVRQVLEGEECAAFRVVLANAAAALLAIERVRSLPEGVEAAREAIQSGRARLVLERLRECCPST